MLDEYGILRGCDHSARLDNLAIALQNDQTLESYVVYYGPRSASDPTIDGITAYLVDARGIPANSIKRVYAGPNNDPAQPRIQLWISPKGLEPHDLEKFESKVKTFNGMYLERDGWDDTYFGVAEGGTGPPIPDVSGPTFVDMLQNQNDTVAYLVVFSGSESIPGSWRRIGQSESDRLKSLGVSSSRIHVLYGGKKSDSEEARVQFWILPRKASPPPASVEPETAPRKKKLIATISEHDLIVAGDSAPFDLLLDVLRASADSRICVIVRLEKKPVSSKEEETTKPQQVGGNGIEEASVEDPTPNVDLLKVVESWKNKLIGEHKIAPDRFIVLFTDPSEDSWNALEAWLVPKGSALPNPNEDLDEEEAEADQSKEKVPAVTVKPN